jgi:hypothetical protein
VPDGEVVELDPPPAVVKVTEYVFWVNVAVTVLAALTVIVVDAEVELANVTDPEGLALQAEKVFEPLGVADMVWPVAPASYHVTVEGDVVPAPDGVTAKVTWYCVL